MTGIPTTDAIAAARATLDFSEAVLRRQHDEAATTYTRRNLEAIATVRRLLDLTERALTKPMTGAA